MANPSAKETLLATEMYRAAIAAACENPSVSHNSTPPWCRPWCMNSIALRRASVCRSPSAAEQQNQLANSP
eukprot:CAMPEP_0170196456 /NCGR_PEP_ID=MMETSP0040_2-20121228/64012_1 /TAXON_ID=641309 /ORGANISM="Lotharella oceanica, Strain CCMP622" /LENGTH=70 /DNA_ID=CAMNT_0010445873 /DNA_START=154 /DNA_END=362 /DNA_ORIENTATION=+